MAKGTDVQIKRGLVKEYIPKMEALSALRGRINITESIKTQTMLKNQMICSYDEFSVNGIMNRIIKSTAELLLRSDISNVRKKELRRLMVYFEDVAPVDLYSVNWNIKYNRNNQTYRMLISICYLVVKGMIQTNSDGSVKLMDFIDEQRMGRLYEKFILEYYRKEYPEIKTNASQITWQLDDGSDVMLPVMQTDIMLSRGEKILIIDTTYYSHTTQSRFGAYKLHSGDLYQIFTYVKNKEIEMENKYHEVSGMLLYAKTDEATLPDNTYYMSGNKISVKTLDLDCDFTEISAQLNTIAESYFDLKIGSLLKNV